MYKNLLFLNFYVKIFMNNEKGEDSMEDIKMISAEELFDKYDEIINITMVNLYTLTKEKGEII